MSEKVLHLTLKKKWFDMIASGEKKEEYREMKPYWHKRLGTAAETPKIVQFRNGYAKDSPVVRIEMKGIMTGLGIIEWGAPPAERVYILRLGKIIETRNHNSEMR